MNKCEFSGTAFNIVNHYLSSKYGEAKTNEDQVKAITQAAFTYLKNNDRPIKRKYRKGAELDSKSAKRLLEAVQKILISVDTPWKPTLKSDSLIQQLFFDLIRGTPPSLIELLKQPSLLKAIVWKKDPELLKEARELVQGMLDDIYGEVSTRELTPQESLHFEIIVGDLLSLLPFLRPENNSELKVPIQIDGKWQMAVYQIEAVPITPKWMGSPYMAYGLSPKNKETVPPLLLFKGTTYPTDKGFLMSLLIDLNPFASVGSYGFHIGKDIIAKWLDDHTTYNKAIVYGKSLGGAQSWRTALYFPEKVAKVMAYGAPGFSSRDKKRLNDIRRKNTLPEINFFSQENDPVPLLGKTAEYGVNYYHVLSGKPQKGVLAHAHMYSTHENSTILSHETFHKDKKWKRIGFTVTSVFLSLIVFPILSLTWGVYNTLNQTGKLIDKHLIQPIRQKM